MLTAFQEDGLFASVSLPSSLRSSLGAIMGRSNATWEQQVPPTMIDDMFNFV
jgi:hypothetical protein